MGGEQCRSMEKLECWLPAAAPLPECDARVAALHAYWRSISPLGRLPGRQHFDPTAIPQLLPYLRLYDVHRDPLRFRYRLVGTEIVRILGRDTTGLWMHEAFPHAPDTPSYRQLVAVATQGGIAYRRGFPVLIVPKDHLLSERLALPLAQNGHEVDIILGLTIHHAARAEFALPRRALAASPA